MIVQNTSADGLTDLTFTVPKIDFKKTLGIVKKIAKEIKAERVLGDENIAKVSIIGLGMRNHAGVATTMFSALADEGINIMMISTSEIKISCVIDEKYTELAVRSLHMPFIWTRNRTDVRAQGVRGATPNGYRMIFGRRRNTGGNCRLSH